MSFEEISSTRASISRIRKNLEDAIVTQAEVCQKLKNASQVSSNSVSLVKYAAVLDEIEIEQAAHARTKAELKQAQDQLELALGEVEILQKQLARERAQFEKTFSLVNKKAACDKVQKVNFSGSESDGQVIGSVDSEVNVMDVGVDGTEKTLATCDSVPNKSTSANELDISASSEDELKEQRPVFTNCSSASLHSNVQKSQKNAMLQTKAVKSSIFAPSHTCAHQDLVRNTIGKPRTKLKSNAKKIMKQ